MPAPSNNARALTVPDSWFPADKSISLRVAAYVCSINKVAKVVTGKGHLLSS